MIGFLTITPLPLTNPMRSEDESADSKSAALNPDGTVTRVRSATGTASPYAGERRRAHVEATTKDQQMLDRHRRNSQ